MVKRIDIRVTNNPVTAKVNKPQEVVGKTYSTTVVAKSQSSAVSTGGNAIQINLNIDGAFYRDGLFQYNYEQVTPSERFSVDFSKSDSESFTRMETVSLSTGKIAIDVFTRVDVASIDVSRVSTETFTRAEIFSIDTSRVSTEAFSSPELFSVSLGQVTNNAFSRAEVISISASTAYSDIAHPTEVMSFDTSAAKSDVASPIETVSIDVSRPATPDAFSSTDTTSLEPNKGVEDLMTGSFDDAPRFDIYPSLVDVAAFTDDMDGSASIEDDIFATVTKVTIDYANMSETTAVDLSTSFGLAVTRTEYAINGGFDTDVSSWTTLNCTATWVSGGWCKLTKTSASSSQLANPIPVNSVKNKNLAVSVDFRNATPGKTTGIRILNASQGFSTVVSVTSTATSGRLEFSVHTPVSDNMQFVMFMDGASGDSVEFDNYSVREIIEAFQSVDAISISLSRPATDTFTYSEDVTLAPNKGVAETATMGEVVTTLWDIGLTPADLATAAESFSVSLSAVRSDTFTRVEVISIDTTKVFSEAVSGPEVVSLDNSKVASDTVTDVDTASISTGKIAADTFTRGESFSGDMQSYFSTGDYVQAGYTGLLF